MKGSGSNENENLPPNKKKEINIKKIQNVITYLQHTNSNKISNEVQKAIDQLDKVVPKSNGQNGQNGPNGQNGQNGSNEKNGHSGGKKTTRKTKKSPKKKSVKKTPKKKSVKKSPKKKSVRKVKRSSRK